MPCKQLTWLIAGYLLLTPLSAFAIDLSGIIDLLNRIRDEQLSPIKDYSEKTLTEIQNLQNLLKGNNGYGTKDYIDHQSWGRGSEQWQSTLNLYHSGTGELGKVTKNLSDPNQGGFPINPDLKKINPKKLQNTYDELQAKTALASRAASQLAFDKIQQQITYMKTLQAKIDQTQDLKSSLDLQNRLIFENNMIQLEMLRMAAIVNQQQAIQTQADVNQSVMNKAFNAY